MRQLAAQQHLTLFLPSRREAVALALLGLAALGTALFFRYALIQNTPLGLACEAGKKSCTCTIRLAAILLFTFSVFGWVSVIVSLIQLWRPHVVLFGIALVFAMLGIVLYNTRASSLAVVLLLLSLARPAPEARRA
jgi:hypothetical protein